MYTAVSDRGGQRDREFVAGQAKLEGRLLEMGRLVESAIRAGTRCLLESDRSPLPEVVKHDLHLHRMRADNDLLTARLLAWDPAVADDVRLLASAKRINAELEQMSDLAVRMVERIVSWTCQTPSPPPVDVPRMARLAETMVRDSLDSFVGRDAELAQLVVAADDTVDSLRDAICRELGNTADLVSIIENLGCIGDRAAAIAEDVLMAVEGMTLGEDAVEIPAFRNRRLSKGS